jgi:hypothetical protein
LHPNKCMMIQLHMDMVMIMMKEIAAVLLVIVTTKDMLKQTPPSLLLQRANASFVFFKYFLKNTSNNLSKNAYGRKNNNKCTQHTN